MFTVYRVQDSNGHGPFKPGFSKRWVEYRPDHEQLLSWIQEFGFGCVRGLLAKETAGCGCRDLEQLRRWFTRNEYRELLRLGYQAVEMDVERVFAEGPTQCVFGRAMPLNQGTRPVKLYADSS